MAGRGEASLAPICQKGIGWEYRAVTCPDRLCPLEEPFGIRENRIAGIDDGERKTGSLVSAFAIEYHRLTGRTMVGVSASQGGTSSAQWCNTLIYDAIRRFQEAQKVLDREGNTPCHGFVLWCQGETDGDHGVSVEQYRNNFLRIWKLLQSAGLQACGLIQIGHYNAAQLPECKKTIAHQMEKNYAVLRDEQQRLSQQIPDVFFAGSFAPHIDLMQDEFHYRQAAYNAVGITAAQAAANYWAIFDKEEVKND